VIKNKDNKRFPGCFCFYVLEATFNWLKLLIYFRVGACLTINHSIYYFSCYNFFLNYYFTFHTYRLLLLLLCTLIGIRCIYIYICWSSTYTGIYNTIGKKCTRERTKKCNYYYYYLCYYLPSKLWRRVDICRDTIVVWTRHPHTPHPLTKRLYIHAAAHTLGCDQFKRVQLHTTHRECQYREKCACGSLIFH